MWARAPTAGYLEVGSRTRTFTDEDRELLQHVAERVAVAVERARLHADVLKLDRLRSNFVAVASHELRTPAAAVYGSLATLARRGDELSEETRERLLQIGYEQGARLCRLLEQLLDLSQLDASAIAVDPKPVELRDMLSEIASQTVPTGTGVELDVSEELTVIVDSLVLERVVTNLLTNAARHGEPPIRISARADGRDLRIRVADSGEGVPEELESRLFERFERADHAQGSGLGLSIARAYARSHGGTLEHEESEQGARFLLTIPLL